MRKLDIILRTHDRGNVHGREFNQPKIEIVHRCLNALQISMEGTGARLIVVDDHSSDATLALLPDDTIHLDGTGNNASMIKVSELAAESTAGIVYLVEDDYLHYPEAISEMLETFEYFQKMTGKQDIAMNGVDCPANYHNLEYASGGRGRDGSIAQIVGGINRAWRTSEHSGFTFMTTPSVINKYWGAFSGMAKGWPTVSENHSINKVWESHVPLFAPLTPLSYHLCEIHPYCPFDKLWRQSKCSHSLKIAV
tara:strand:+ start:824 stop:1579 length:756 start_codon:yes stop_codon:yes gene_type:complete